MGVGRFNSTHNAHARYHVTVGGGYKITTYLESETHSFLPTTQLLSGYDDNINGRLLSRALPVLLSSVFRQAKTCAFFQVHPS